MWCAHTCRFQSHIKKSGRGKLPWRYRWPDDVRDDILARLLALNAQRAELERLTGLPAAATTPNRDLDSARDTAGDSDSTAAPPAKAKRVKKAAKRVTKKSAPRPMFDDPAP